jgi:spoIIIJ-associated protein
VSDLDVSPETAPAQTAVDSDLLVREGDIAADYLERLLDIIDYDGDIGGAATDRRAQSADA